MARRRGSGSIYKQKNSAFWWIQYCRNGKVFRESTKTEDKEEAKDFLNKRLGEIATGTFSGLEVERILISELAEDFLRDYRINNKKSIDDVEARWELHLKTFLGDLRASQLTTNLLARYIDQRQQEKAKNATINRELAALKRMFRLGYQATPPKVNRVPKFPKLQENNARQGFLEDAQYSKLVSVISDLWLRALVEVGKTYGWRISELLSLRVCQVNLLNRTLRLEPGTTKNNEGREVTMTTPIYALLAQCVAGKSEEDFVFTWKDGRPIRDFRKRWKNVCKEAGTPKLLFHDLRRTAARNLRAAGVAEGVIMKIGGWKTRSVFERYAIVSQTDIAEALHKLECTRRAQTGGEDYPNRLDSDIQKHDESIS